MQIIQCLIFILVSLFIYDILWVGFNWVLPLKLMANYFYLGSKYWKGIFWCGRCGPLSLALSGLFPTSTSLLCVGHLQLSGFCIVYVGTYLHSWVHAFWAPAYQHTRVREYVVIPFWVLTLFALVTAIFRLPEVTYALRMHILCTV